MANERMTVMDLVEKVKDLRETVDKLDRLNAVMQSDAAIHDGAVRLLEEKFGLKHDPVYMLNGARNKLSEYADMLERIMRETELPWPPSVDMAGQR